MTSPLMLLGALTPAEPTPTPLPADDSAVFAAALAAALALGPKEIVAPTPVVLVTVAAPDGEATADAEGDATVAGEGEASVPGPTPSGTTLLGESAEPERPAPSIAVPTLAVLAGQDASGKPVGRQAPQPPRVSLERTTTGAIATQREVLRPSSPNAESSTASAQSNGTVAPAAGAPAPPDQLVVATPTLTEPASDRTSTEQAAVASPELGPLPAELPAPAPARAEAGPSTNAPAHSEPVPTPSGLVGPPSVEGSRRNQRRMAEPPAPSAAGTSTPIAIPLTMEAGGTTPVTVPPTNTSASAPNQAQSGAPTDRAEPLAGTELAQTLCPTPRTGDTTPAPRPVTRPTRPTPRIVAADGVATVASAMAGSGVSPTLAAIATVPVPVPTAKGPAIRRDGTNADSGDASASAPRADLPNEKVGPGRPASSLRPLATAFAQIVAELLADAPIREIRVQSVQSGEGKPMSDPATSTVSTAAAVPTDQAEMPVSGAPRAAAAQAASPLPARGRNPIVSGSLPAEAASESNRTAPAPGQQLDAPVVRPPSAGNASPVVETGSKLPTPAAALVGESPASSVLVPTPQSSASATPMARRDGDSPALERDTAVPPAIDAAIAREMEQVIPDRPRYSGAVAAADGDAARSRRADARRGTQPLESSPTAAAPRGQQPARMAAKALVDTIPTRLDLPAPLGARAAETKLPADRQELPAPAVDLTGTTSGPEAAGPSLRERASDDARSASAPPASLTAPPPREGERSVEAPRGEARNLPRGGVSEERPAANADRVTLQVIDQEGRSTRIRVAVLGQQIRAVIVPQDGEGGRHLEQRMDELHAALARQGFVDSRVTVQSSGTEQTTSWASPAANAPAAPGTSRGTDQPPGEQRQGSGRRDQGRQGDGQRHPQGRSRDREEDSRRR